MSATESANEAQVQDFSNSQNDLDLEQIHLLTQMMREHEKQVVSLAKQRRRLMRGLRERRIPFRILAKATGTTEQAVYKDLRWGK